MSFKTPVCTMCNIKFQNFEVLEVHMKKVHLESDHNRLERLSKTFEPVKRTKAIKVCSYDCTECGILFSSLEEQRCHIENYHNFKLSADVNPEIIIDSNTESSYSQKESTTDNNSLRAGRSNH